jgi:hypothetical protein
MMPVPIAVGVQRHHIATFDVVRSAVGGGMSAFVFSVPLKT